MYEFEHLAPEPDVVVEMGAFGTARDGETIGTYALGSCTGVGIYDPDTKTAYVSHSDGVTDLAQLDATLEHLRDQGADPSRLKAWVAGGMEVVVDGEMMGMTLRGETLGTLQEAGIPLESIEVRWLEPGEVADLCIDTEAGTGRIFVDYEDLWLQDQYHDDL